MIDRTHQLTNIIINKVASMSMMFNRNICWQYDGIVTKISAMAASTSALVELQNYIDRLRSKELPEIQVY